jgi:CRP/FNR family transcriptional regulator
MDNKTVVNISDMHIGCKYCHLLPFCRPHGTSPSRQKMRLLNQITIHTHKYERGDHLFLANDKFRVVFVVRSGSVKTYGYLPDGGEQLTGLHLAGKMLGLDAIGTGLHSQSAMALETCSICEISFTKLENLSIHLPQLQHLLLYVLSQEIRDDHYQLTLLSRMPATARLAGFLLRLSHYFQQQGYSASNFNLSLSRHDIANLLGLAVETVSRLFTQFQDEGLLTAERKHIVLRDIEGLMKLSPAYNDRGHKDAVIRDGLR